MQATVSIIIPAYNADAYLEETIRGVVAQTFQDWELLVVNNASTDSTGDILHRLTAELCDPRIRILTNPCTLSMAENWNIGLQHAKGEFIKMICADDIPSEDCLERQVRALREHPSAILTSGARLIINSKGKILFLRNAIRKKGVHTGTSMIRQCIFAGTNIIGDPVCVMWRRSATDQLGLFNPSVGYCTDMEYWLRLLSIGDLYYDTVPVGFYRIHKNAAAVRLANVVASDVVHAAKLQTQRGSITLSRFDFFLVSTKATLLSFLRQICYKHLG
ncbi:MAG: glycosyltransferase family 2 protein [Aliarcobacter sp.]